MLVGLEPRKSDAGARLALDAGGVGTWEIRPVTGEHVVSARTRDLLGIKGDEAISIQRLLAALHQGDRQRWKDAVEQVLDAKRSGERYLEFRTAGPAERWLAASGRAFFEGTGAVRVAGTLQDITEKKRTDKERDARLEELGHDLRMPLGAISMGVQLLQRDLPAKAEILSAMQLTLQRMYRLIDQLLGFARSGTGERVLNREPLPLAEICQEAIDEALRAHPGHPIEFENWADAPGEWDRDRLLQVVRNLLSNAISHGAPGKPIIVSVFDIGEEAVLAVANRGRPIPDPVREHLLDPTRRGAWSSDHLGLDIVKEIVHAHGGRIKLTSDDSGTVFHLWLPKKLESSTPRDDAKVNDRQSLRSHPADVVPSKEEAS
jgi:sigma-B regulation protein RsbU (phosphoserine phosphatase)